MKKLLLLTLLLFISFQQNYACTCACEHDGYFGTTVYNSDFVALVKVISFNSHLKDAIANYQEKMPESITVEVIKKYKGRDYRKHLRIWRGTGNSCNLSLDSLQLGQYYLITPSRSRISTSNKGISYDYVISGCCTNMLFVDYDKKKAFGDYAPDQKKVALTTIEEDLISGKFEESAKTKEKTKNQEPVKYSIFQQIGILTLILIGCILGVVILSRLKNKPDY